MVVSKTGPRYQQGWEGQEGQKGNGGWVQAASLKQTHPTKGIIWNKGGRGEHFLMSWKKGYTRSVPNGIKMEIRLLLGKHEGVQPKHKVCFIGLGQAIIPWDTCRGAQITRSETSRG